MKETAQGGTEHADNDSPQQMDSSSAFAPVLSYAPAVKCLANRFAMATTVTVGGSPQGSGMMVACME